MVQILIGIVFSINISNSSHIGNIGNINFDIANGFYA